MKAMPSSLTTLQTRLLAHTQYVEYMMVKQSLKLTNTRFANSAMFTQVNISVSFKNVIKSSFENDV